MITLPNIAMCCNEPEHYKSFFELPLFCCTWSTVPEKLPPTPSQKMSTFDGFGFDCDGDNIDGFFIGKDVVDNVDDLCVITMLSFRLPCGMFQ